MIAATMERKVLIFSLLINAFLLLALLYGIHRLGGFSYLKYRLQNKGNAGVYENRKQLFETLPVHKNNIVFLGNSIIEQCEWSELFGNPNIINRGIAGDVAVRLLERLDPIIKGQPAKIFLLIGINDLIYGGLDDLRNNYPLILEKIKTSSPNTKIYVHSLLPINPNLRKMSLTNEGIKAFNEELKKIASEAKVVYINLHDELIDEQNNLNVSYSTDGIHLNGEAYQIWKHAIEKYVGSD